MPEAALPQGTSRSELALWGKLWGRAGVVLALALVVKYCGAGAVSQEIFETPVVAHH
jgi:hypothetical protein